MAVRLKVSLALSPDWAKPTMLMGPMLNSEREMVVVALMVRVLLLRVPVALRVAGLVVSLTVRLPVMVKG